MTDNSNSASDLPALPEDQAGRVRVVLEQVVAACGVEAEVKLSETDDAIRVDVAGDDAGRLIGRRAQTLDAIQLLAYLISSGGEKVDAEGSERPRRPKRVIIDIDGYRAEREQELIGEADRVAQQVLSSGEPAELEPMTSQERRAVHTHLLTINGVETHSEGEDPDRRIVISPG